MNRQIAPQHPAVVLRSHYVHVRALLVIAMGAVVVLAVAVAILASATRTTTVRYTATPSTLRFDGGPEEGTAGH